jgi:hypothetical protein
MGEDVLQDATLTQGIAACCIALAYTCGHIVPNMFNAIRNRKQHSRKELEHKDPVFPV